MSWGSGPNLERRASSQNQDWADRSAAQHELYRREADNEMRLNDARAQIHAQGQNTGPSQKSFFDSRAGYVGFLMIGAVVVGVLLNPAEIQATLSQDGASEPSLPSLWIGFTVALWFMLFISLTMLNRGPERLLLRLRKRFIFSIGFAVIASSLMVARMAML